MSSSAFDQARPSDHRVSPDSNYCIVSGTARGAHLGGVGFPPESSTTIMEHTGCRSAVDGGARARAVRVNARINHEELYDRISPGSRVDVRGRAKHVLNY